VPNRDFETYLEDIKKSRLPDQLQCAFLTYLDVTKTIL
jgi:hypothetical protein